MITARASIMVCWRQASATNSWSFYAEDLLHFSEAKAWEEQNAATRMGEQQKTSTTHREVDIK